MKGFDPQGLRIQRETIELGCDYADAALRYLTDRRPGEPTLEDGENFYVGCAGTMIAMMYAFVYKAAGQERADNWLAKIFMGIPAMVRTKGVPLLLTINANARPLDIPPEAEKKVKPGLIGKAPGECICGPGAEPPCGACLDKMKGILKALVTCHGNYLKEMGEATKGFVKNECQACSLSSIDPALASIVAGDPLNGGPASNSQFGNQLAVFIEGLAHQLGVKELPLTEKAWADKEMGAN